MKNYIVHVPWEILLQVHYRILDTQKRIIIVKTYTVVALRGDASNSKFCSVWANPDLKILFWSFEVNSDQGELIQVIIVAW